jgi:hypothetical protein
MDVTTHAHPLLALQKYATLVNIRQHLVRTCTVVLPLTTSSSFVTPKKDVTTSTFVTSATTVTSVTIGSGFQKRLALKLHDTGVAVR